MTVILADHNLEGQAQLILTFLAAEAWLEAFPLLLVGFADTTRAARTIAPATLLKEPDLCYEMPELCFQSRNFGFERRDAGL